MTRTIDLSEVKTALLAVGPEKEDGSRIETVVVDDEAQEIFGLLIVIFGMYMSLKVTMRI